MDNRLDEIKERLVELAALEVGPGLDDFGDANRQELLALCYEIIHDFQQTKEAMARLEQGKPLGELVGKQTILNMAREIAALQKELAKTHKLWEEVERLKGNTIELDRHHKKEHEFIINLQAQLAQTREALELAISTFGHEHWDPTMQHGIGCDYCVRQGAARSMAARALAGEEK